MVNKRAQASIEFLATYGWALLVVIVSVSALAYFGVFNFDIYKSDYCNFGSNVDCSKDYMVGYLDNYGSGIPTLLIQLKNKFGADVNITSARVTTDESLLDCVQDGGGIKEVRTKIAGLMIDNELPAAIGDTISDAIPKDETFDLEISCEGVADVNPKQVEFTIELDFHAIGSGNIHTLKATAKARLNPT